MKTRVMVCIVALLFCIPAVSCNQSIASNETEQSKEVPLYQIAAVCNTLIQDDSFLQLIDAIERDAQDKDTVYKIDYDHMEYPEVPDNIHIHIPGILDPTVTDPTYIPKNRLPGDQLIQAFQRFEESHGPFDECEHILVNHGEYGTMVAFRISYSVSHRLSTYLVKGDPVNALHYYSGFTEPDIGVKRTMEFISVADGWYVVCFDGDK